MYVLDESLQREDSKGVSMCLQLLDK